MRIELSCKSLLVLAAVALITGCNSTVPNTSSASSNISATSSYVVIPPNPSPLKTDYELETERAFIDIERQPPGAKAHMATGDFDGDGRIELMALEAPKSYYDVVYTVSESQAKKLLEKHKFDWKDAVRFYEVKEDGKGIFEASINFTNQNSLCLGTSTPIVADFNDDGIDDVVFPCAGYDNHPFPGEYDYSMISGTDGWFTYSKISRAQAVTGGGSALDIDNDGDLDVVMISSNPRASRLESYLNDGSGKFTYGKVISTFPTAGYTSTATDLNNDGYPEIVVGGIEEWFPAKILWNDGAGGFEKKTSLPKVRNYGVVLDIHKIGNNLVLVRTGDGFGSLKFYQGGAVQVISLDTLKTTSLISHKNNAHPTQLRAHIESDGSIAYRDLQDYRKWTDFKLVKDKPLFLN